MGKIETLIPIVLFNVFFIFFVAGIIVFIREYKLKKKEYNAKLSTQEQAHQQELLATQVEIQNQTMQYIGREIHDNIGQKLTLASLYTQQLAFENKAPEIKESIENISNIINKSLSELRNLSKSLTDDAINDSPLEDLLQTEVEKINELKKCIVTFDHDTNNLELNYQVKCILLRISQEFMQNSVKHSRCAKIAIVLTQNSNNLQLNLQDDGVGFDTKNAVNSGIGLLNMKKRTEIIGGTFLLQTQPNNGTKILISIPV